MLQYFVLSAIPNNNPCIYSAVRKINELVKRVRLCKVHAYIIGHLREQMPMLMGHNKKQKEVGLVVLGTVFNPLLFCLAPRIYICLAISCSSTVPSTHSPSHLLVDREPRSSLPFGDEEIQSGSWRLP
ncbi:hypothetical protein EON65_18600 [archaeon]|nr:MAG: hypothetical protein EON65_18600 [archaeon]